MRRRHSGGPTDTATFDVVALARDRNWQVGPPRRVLLGLGAFCDGSLLQWMKQRQHRVYLARPTAAFTVSATIRGSR